MRNERPPHPLAARIEEYARAAGVTTTHVSLRLGDQALYHKLVRGRRPRSDVFETRLEDLWTELRAKARVILEGEI